jgi:hypothetical protein
MSHPGSNGSNKYKPMGSQYERNGYGRSEPAKDEFEIPVLRPEVAVGVDTQIQGGKTPNTARYAGDSRKDVILVQQNISRIHV